ncbi:NUDIX domain-containing protein [Actinophytocola oryzae]|uniref:ADP-ribose pyrophosphatase YjhB (NUDIX family) n=1 Tax=Actinophytocola oryzae TaxID=502181 RepID=A0A4V3FSU2_9PSEU|nr:NUDIX domain-containing protein [Actinophytocola oryzae]TDV48801.1 ADP-ribose pyrophosphatase YjhB (NUDIX family) [Actinophytocola oryzae]
MIDEKTGWYFVHASVKAVVVDDGSVLLCRTHRDDWELPGGWPDRADRTLADTVVREVREECGIEVTAGDVIHADLFRVGDNPVVIVVLVATPTRPYSLTHSVEHRETRFFPTAELPSPLPPVYRDAIRKAEAHA